MTIDKPCSIGLIITRGGFLKFCCDTHDFDKDGLMKEECRRAMKSIMMRLARLLS